MCLRDRTRRRTRTVSWLALCYGTTSSTHERTSFESWAMNNRCEVSSVVLSGSKTLKSKESVLLCLEDIVGLWRLKYFSAVNSLGASSKSTKYAKPPLQNTKHSILFRCELCNKIVINSFSDDDCHKTKLKKDEKDCPQLKTEHPTSNNSLKFWTHWPIGWLCVCLERKTVSISVESESFFLWREEQLTSALTD